MFAMIDPDCVVDRVVTVIHNSIAMVAGRPDLTPVALPPNPPHPVGKGWTFRDGVFYSPAVENGFGAGERQVRAAK